MAKGEKRRLIDEEDGGDDAGCCRMSIYDDWVRPCVAEFLGTLIFVFIGVMSLISENDLVIATAHGLVILLLSAAFISVSGAHFNPAITLSVLIVGYINPVKALLYVFFQLLGATAAAGIVKGLVDSLNYDIMQGGSPTVVFPTSLVEALVLEGVLVFILVLVILVAEVDEESPLAPVAHGMVYLVGVAISYNISGGVLNPARSLGPSAIYSFSSTDQWKEQWIYYVAGAAGSVVAAVVFKLALASNGKRWACTEPKKRSD